MIAIARAPQLMIVLVAVALTSSPAAAWRTTLDGGIGFARANAIVRDSAGQLIAGGVDGNEDFLVAKVDAASGAEIWRHSIDGSFPDDSDDEASSVTVDSADDVIAGGVVVNVAPGLTQALIVKLAAATGAEIWRRAYDSGSIRATVGIHAVAVDSAGDVVATGLADSGSTSFAAKLDGATGVEVWHVELPGSVHARALTLDGTGNPIIGGGIDSSHFAVLKLDGATGAEIWRQEIESPSVGAANAVVVDGAGDVVAVGLLGASDVFAYTVVKFAGATGAEIWRQELHGTSSEPIVEDEAFAVQLDSAGDVVTAGQIDNAVGLGFNDRHNWDFAVVKFSGASGALLWRRELEGDSDRYTRDVALAVAVDASDDVVAAGTILGKGAAGQDFAVVKLAGSSGATLWQQAIDGTSNEHVRVDQADAVIVDDDGNAFAAGAMTNVGNKVQFGLLRLAALDGGVGPVPGNKLLVRQPGDDATAQKLVFVLKDLSLVTASPGSAGDPTLFGATLRLQNPTTLETAVIPLPASSWSGLGVPAGAAGYRYVGGSSGDPCTSLLVMPRRLLKGSCNGRAGVIPFSLDEASQGTLVASLQLGSAEAQCAKFGPGSVAKDVGIAGPGTSGVFKAARVLPGSGACP